MSQHPAHQLARMAADAAEELRGYTDPADPFPWELTEDDHRAILPRLHHAIAHLAVCIDGIAQATGDEHAKRQLAEGIGRLLSGCTHVSAASAMLSAPGEEPDAEPAITTQPAQLSAADFPAAMTAACSRRPPGLQRSHPARPRRSRPRTHARTARSRAVPRPGKRPRLPWQVMLPHTRQVNLIQINEDHLLTLVDHSGRGCLRCL